MRLPGSDALLRLAVRVSLVAACAIPPFSLAFAFPLFNRIPRWDQWSLIPLWEAHCDGRPVLPHLLAPYNGHLNVVPRFIFYGAGLLTGWELRFEVLLIYLCASATLATLVWMLRDPDDRLLLLAGPVAALVFTFTQVETFVTGYHLGQHLEQLALTQTIFLLTRPRITTGHVLGAIAAAAVATFSWGGGLVAWPLGVVALMARGWKRPGLAMLWIAAAAVSLVPVKRSVVGGHVIQLGELLDLLDPAFILAMVGRPVTRHAFPQPPEALLMGAVLALAFVLGLAWAWLSGRRSLGPCWALPWGLLGAAAFANAALVSLTRSRAGLEHALVSHYATATYSLAVAALVLVGGALLSRVERWPAALLLAALLAATTWQVAKASHETYLIVRGWNAISVAIDEKLLAGTITDDEIRSALHPDAELVRRGTAMLRRCGLTVFRQRPTPPS